MCTASSNTEPGVLHQDDVYAEDYTKYIDYIIRLYLQDKSYLDGTITQYNSESITVRFKDNNKKTKTFDRSLILDLKILNIPKNANKNNKKSTANVNNKKNNNNNNSSKNDSTFGMLDINTIKNTEFNFEDNNSKYDYNRIELKSQNSDEAKCNDEEKNDLIVDSNDIKPSDEGSKKETSKSQKGENTKVKKEKQKKGKQQAKLVKDIAAEDKNFLKEESPSIESINDKVEKGQKKKKGKKQSKQLKTEVSKDTDNTSTDDNSLLDIDSLPITKAINLSHLCDLLNSESIKRHKLKKKNKKTKKTSNKEVELEADDNFNDRKEERLTFLKQKEIESKQKTRTISSDSTSTTSSQISDSDISSLSSDNDFFSATSGTPLSSSSSDEEDSFEDSFDDINSLDKKDSNISLAKKNKKSKKTKKASDEILSEPNLSLIDESLVMKILLDKAVKAGLLSKETAEKQQLLNANLSQPTTKQDKVKAKKKNNNPKQKKKQNKKLPTNNQSTESLDEKKLVTKEDGNEKKNDKKPNNTNNNKKKKKNTKSKQKATTPVPNTPEDKE